VLAGPPAGPPALAAHAGLAFGVLLLGPDTTYPAHVHPAAELYLPLGRARWSTGGRPLAERAAGVPIVHVPNEPHATQTAEAPLAALYVWLGELGTAAQILSVPPDLRDPE
jgi:Dimethlysulfonioproprionate lyase